MFKPSREYDLTDNDECKAMDQECVSKAVAYLKQVMNKITGYDPKSSSARGSAYRSIYKEINQRARSQAIARYGNAAYLLHNVSLSDETESKASLLMDKLKDAARTIASESSAEYGATLVKRLLKKTGAGIFKIRRVYNSDKETSLGRSRIALCRAEEKKIQGELAKIAPELSRIIDQYDKCFINVIMSRRAAGEDNIDILNELSSAEAETLDRGYKLFLRLISVYTVHNNVLRVIDELELRKNHAIGAMPNAPSSIELTRQDMARYAAQPAPDYEWK